MVVNKELAGQAPLDSYDNRCSWAKHSKDSLAKLCIFYLQPPPQVQRVAWAFADEALGEKRNAMLTCSWLMAPWKKKHHIITQQGLQTNTVFSVMQKKVLMVVLVAVRLKINTSCNVRAAYCTHLWGCIQELLPVSIQHPTSVGFPEESFSTPYWISWLFGNCKEYLGCGPRPINSGK